MYLKELKLWNFRKYGSTELFDLDKPNLVVPFTKGLNVLIGENDSGKTAILDAIKLVLKTHAYEWLKIEDTDFYDNSTTLRVELEFRGIETNEAKNFIEWLGWTKEEVDGKEVDVSILKLIYQVEKRNGKLIPADVKAGMDGVGYPLNAEARDYLKTTYLKALRDADNDLTAKKNSRLSQILQEHKLFKKSNPEEKHLFEEEFKKVNDLIAKQFEEPKNGETNLYHKEIKSKIDDFLKRFIDENKKSRFSLGENEIKNILEKISLGIVDAKNLGLGTMNRLYMAAELLHLKREWDGLKLCMIEELEAHLHPQAQMKIVEALEKETGVQFILTTHSPNLASKVPLKNLILCKDNNAFPLGEGYTKLDSKNYLYLERFLDVTKSNLFFSKGVIIVEGWSEEILLPELAKKLGFDLTEKEVSIINVASTAYLHFARIFLRNDEKKLNIPVSIITDLDNRPDEKGVFVDTEKTKKKNETFAELRTALKDTTVELFIAKEWTLEWCLFKSTSLSTLFKESVSAVHSGTDEFKDGKFDESKFISKLKKEKETAPLDKVQIANELANKIEKVGFTIQANDEYLKYLIDAIKHACDEN
jgi:putative ATP-dependent endonuclease of OLD family